MQTRIILPALLVLSLFTVSHTAFAVPPACQAVHDPAVAADAKAKVAKDAIVPLINDNPIRIIGEVTRTLKRQELPLYQERLDKLLAANNGVLTTRALKAFYDSMFFPDALSQPRLEMAKRITPDNILQVLGDLTNQETLRLYVGDRPDRVLPDSILGRYLAESGALLQRRSFTEKGTMAAGQVPRTGKRRYVVPVDAANFELFKKYFSNEFHQTYSVFGHAHPIWEGKLLYQMGGFQVQDFNFPGKNAPLPLVLLKTTEGQRMQNFITAFQKIGRNTNQQPNFGRQGWDNPARAPWSYIPAVGGGRYMEVRSKYSCCVQYQGNIPIGDRLVTKITLPSAGIPEPGQNAWNVMDVPVEVDLHPPDYSNAPDLEPVKNIWTYPLHEPFSAVLGLAQNNGQGEFASSGWLIQTLMVSAPLDRVPFVIIFTDNAKAKLDPNLPLHFEQP